MGRFAEQATPDVLAHALLPASMYEVAAVTLNV